MRLRWIWLTIALLLWPLAPGARGQGSRKDDIVLNARGLPLAGATVRVCAMPASDQPCTPLALIYSDAALTQALANPTTTDGLGNYYFYAAPGKYMIEISGTGITTRQMANVILPNDPTAPAFGSVSSSGAMSAFSLNLGGNLTVNGNATVVGSLAGGTLNLTNQGTAPSAASAGTVNLYTKSTDKRLYYKDDSGNEVGPVSGGGVSAGATNTWTAQQNFDANTAFKGPNPWYDITRYGGKARTNPPPSTTGSMTTGTATLTLAAAQDFANGDGIVVLKAGPLSVLAQTTGLAVTATNTPIQIVNPPYATYADYAAGKGAVRSGNTVTLTFYKQHGFTTGQSIVVAGVTDSSFNGTFTVATVPNTYQVTYAQTAANSSSGGGTATLAAGATTYSYQVAACDYNDACGPASAVVQITNGQASLGFFNYNKLLWTAPADPSSVANYAIYRNGTLIHTSPTNQFFDYGITYANLPPNMPTTPPGAAQNGLLSTTISSGGGTTTLTLATSASATVSGATVLHDEAPAIRAAFAAMTNYIGTTYVPNIGAWPNVFVINSPLKIPAGNAVLKIAGLLFLNRPIYVFNGANILGDASAGNDAVYNFQHIGSAAIVGTSSPLMASTGNPGASNYFSNLSWQPSYQGQTGYASLNHGAGMTYNECGASTGSGDTFGFPFVIYGGFTFNFYGGSYNGALAYPAQPVIRFTADPNGGDFSRYWYFLGTNFAYQGLQVDTNGGVTGEPGSAMFLNNLYESGESPFLTVTGTVGFFSGQYQFSNTQIADILAGYVPLLENQNGAVYDVSARQVVAVNNQPMFLNTAGYPIRSLVVEDSFVANGAGDLSLAAGIGQATNYQFSSNNNNLSLSSAGQLGSHFIWGSPLHLANSSFLGVVMPPPTGFSAAVAAGGSLLVGNNMYSVIGVDASGNLTAESTRITVTTSSGNQTVNTSWTALPGAVSYHVHRVDPNGNHQEYTGITTTSFSDTNSANNGTQPPGMQFGDAMISRVDSQKVSAPQFVVNNEAFSASPRALQNSFLPGALNTTWTGATWTIDKPITVTRVEAQAKTAPAGCTTNAVVRVTDGTTPVNVTISAAANTSGALTQNYAAGAAITIGVTTAAAGCTTSPADANVTVQYKMQ